MYNWYKVCLNKKGTYQSKHVYLIRAKNAKMALNQALLLQKRYSYRGETYTPTLNILEIITHKEVWEILKEHQSLNGRMFDVSSKD